MRNPRTVVPILWLLMVAATGSAQTPTVEDFGFNCWTRNGVEAQGEHPLLLILADYAGTVPLQYDSAYYQDLIFDRESRHSLNGFVYENSNNLFWWGAAAPTPVYVTMPDSSSFPALKTAYPDSVYGSQYSERLWFTHVIQSVMDQGLFPFQDFDTIVDDDIIRSGELAILILASDPGQGLARYPLLVEGPLVDVDIGYFAVAALQDPGWPGPGEIDFNVLVHESLHLIGMKDTYGACDLNTTLSLSGGRTESPRILDEIYHLDPRQKMNLGWVTPALASIRNAGAIRLYAPQSILTSGVGTVLLYDPLIAYDEYFILEYRNPNSPWDNEYDVNVAGNGVVIWHIWTNGQGDCNPRDVYFTCDPGDHAFGYLADGAPDLEPGDNQVWGAGDTTPRLKWYDPVKPEDLPVQITVGNFNSTDGSVLVSWTPQERIWVDFTHTGIESGTYIDPFNTVQEAIDAASAGAYIYCKSGSTMETLTINKAVTLVSHRGVTTIGQP